MSAMMFVTVLLITSTYPLFNSDFAFSAVLANTMNNRHHRQSVINSVSWMKATQMGLITHSMRRPVNMGKIVSFREYILKKKSNLIMNFAYKVILSQITNSEIHSVFK